MNHLEQASASGQFAAFNALLANGTDPYISGNSQYPSLHRAAADGHLPVVNALLAKGADANLKDCKGRTALQCAADYGHLAIYDALLSRTHQPDLNRILKSFSILGCLDQVEALLANGADPNIPDCFKYTSLHHAADNGHLAVVNALLANGADANLKECNGRTALQCAADSGRLAVYEALLARTHQPDLNRILQSFSRLGYLDLVKALLGNGADANNKDCKGWTALHFAADNGHLAVVNALLANGAAPNIPDHYQYTPLHCAAANGYLGVVNALLAKRADPNTHTRTGDTPLGLAAAVGHLSVCGALLPRTHQPELNRLLQKFSGLGCSDQVEALLAQGVDPDTQTREGDTPLGLAAANGHLAVVNDLLANGADPNIPGNDQYTPLHHAAANGHLAVVNTLLANGADANLKEGNGQRALQYGRSAIKTIQNFLPLPHPLSLQYLVRSSIRARLVQRLRDGGQPLKPAIESLPLPVAMKKYVFNPLTL